MALSAGRPAATQSPSRWRAARRPGRRRSRTPQSCGVALAQIAGVAFLDDQLDQRLAAERLGQRPGLRLGQPHQRRLDGEGAPMPSFSARLQRVQRVAPAVGIAGIVGLAHAADQRVQPAPVGQGRGVGEEDQIAARARRWRAGPRSVISMARSAVMRRLADGAEARGCPAGGRRPAARPSAGNAWPIARAHHARRASSSTACRWP